MSTHKRNLATFRSIFLMCRPGLNLAEYHQISTSSSSAVSWQRSRKSRKFKAGFQTANEQIYERIKSSQEDFQMKSDVAPYFLNWTSDFEKRSGHVTLELLLPFIHGSYDLSKGLCSHIEFEVKSKFLTNYQNEWSYNTQIILDYA